MTTWRLSWRDHPAEAIARLIDNGALVQVGWQRQRGDIHRQERTPSAARTRGERPVYAVEEAADGE